MVPSCLPGDRLFVAESLAWNPQLLKSARPEAPQSWGSDSSFKLIRKHLLSRRCTWGFARLQGHWWRSVRPHSDGGDGQRWMSRRIKEDTSTGGNPMAQPWRPRRWGPPLASSHPFLIYLTLLSSINPARTTLVLVNIYLALCAGLRAKRLTRINSFRSHSKSPGSSIFFSIMKMRHSVLGEAGAGHQPPCGSSGT